MCPFPLKNTPGIPPSDPTWIATGTTKRIFDHLVDFARRNGYAPTIREIGDAVGLRSTSTVHYHLDMLKRARWISFDAGKNRAIKVLRVDAPPPPGLDELPPPDRTMVRCPCCSYQFKAADHVVEPDEALSALARAL